MRDYTLDRNFMLTDFQNSFIDRLAGKFAIKSLLNIPPHLKHVATATCQILMFKKLHTINDRLVTDEPVIQLVKTGVRLIVVVSEVRINALTNITTVSACRM